MNHSNLIDSSVRHSLTPEVINAIENGHLLEVSGRPLFRDHPEGQGSLWYNDTALEIGVVVLPFSVRQMNIPTVGHRHLDPAFLGTYPVLSGVNPESDLEYLFGATEALKFSVDVVSSSMNQTPLEPTH